jgi:hypothetical protein
MKALLFTSAIIFIAIKASADDRAKSVKTYIQKDYNQSQRCAGALSIMTSLGLADEASPIYKYFDDLLNFHSIILKYYVSEIIDGSSMKDVSEAVSKGIVQVDEEYMADPNSFQVTVKHCLSWLSEAQIHFSKQEASSPAYKVMEAMPRPSNSYEYPFSDWSPMIPVTESAYELWNETDLRELHQCKSSGLKTIDCFSQNKNN